MAITANLLVFGFFALPFFNRYYCPPDYSVKVIVGEKPQEEQEQEQPQKQDQEQDHQSTPNLYTDNNDQEENQNLLDNTNNNLHYKQDDDDHHQQQHHVEEVILPNPYNLHFLQHVRTWDCWLFWLALTGISSTGGTLVAAAYQMFASLSKGQLDSSAPTLNIGLIGIGGALGRILIGLFEETFLTPRRYPASIIFPIPPLPALLGLVLMPFVPPTALWFPFFLVSCGYGMSWALLLLNARQMFSVDVAQNYLFIFSAGLPTVALQRGVLGPWYDAATERQGAAPGKCLGIECVSLPIIVMAGMCLVGVLLSFWVHVRWMRRNGLGMVETVPELKKK